jgi:hypothetical protein
MPTELKQMNKACGYTIDGGVPCNKQVQFGKANPKHYCQKHFLKWQRANLEKSTSDNNGSGSGY